MDKRHKEILRVRRVDLVDNINIDDGLVTQLLSRKVITSRTANKIQACGTREAKVEQLLDILNGPYAFQGLCDSLIAVEQEYIVDLYLKDNDKCKTDDSCPNSEIKRTQETEQNSQNLEKVPVISESLPRDVTLANASESSGPSGSCVLAPSQSQSQFQYSAMIHEKSPDRICMPKSYLGKHDAYHYSSELENTLMKESEWQTYKERMYHSKTVPDRDMYSPYSDRMYVHKGMAAKNMPEYTIDREHEDFLNNRMHMKHYVTKDSVYDLPNMTPREVFVAHQMSPEFDSRLTHPHKEFVRLHPGDREALSRNDSLDGMTKRPFHPSQNNQELPGTKRLRTEETLILPGQDGSGGPIRVRDSFYDPRSPYKSEPEIFMVDPSSQRKCHMSTIPAVGEFDDPDIDLTDGPVAVKVGICQRQFYLSHFKKSYAMRRIPRGQALIINVNEVEGKPPRRGTDIDRDNLHNLLTQLHFNVLVYNDQDKLSAEEIGKKLQKFAMLDDHYQADCCVVCLLSHGEDGYLFGTDGRKLELDKIFSLFDNNSCKSLIGKPKIFVIQACRGGALDEGVCWSQTDEIDGSHPSRRQLPTMSDMIICYPTQSGYYAWRNRERGSWYIEALVQVLMKYAKNEDVCTMLNRVNQLVSRKISRCPQIEMDQMSQMSEYKSTLRKPHLFFFPGIGSV